MGLEIYLGQCGDRSILRPKGRKNGVAVGAKPIQMGDQSLCNTVTKVEMSRPPDLEPKPARSASWAAQTRHNQPGDGCTGFSALAFLGTWRTLCPAILKPIIDFGLMFLENILIFSKTWLWRNRDLSRGQAGWNRSEDGDGWFRYWVDAAIKSSGRFLHVLQCNDPHFHSAIRNIFVDPVLLASDIIMYFRRTVTGWFYLPQTPRPPTDTGMWWGSIKKKCQVVIV